MKVARALLLVGALGLIRDAAAAYSYFKPVTIDRTRVGNAGAPASLADFPLLYHVTDPDLRTTANGGKVSSVNGYDIVFRAADGVTLLAHEVQKYVAATGELVAWVRIPNLNTQSAGSNTVIRNYYGNSGITSPTQNPTEVWDAAFQAVWHLDGNAASPAKDSTANANDGTQSGGVTFGAGGKVGAATGFDGVNDLLEVPHRAGLSLGSLTISAWVRLRSSGPTAEASIVDKRGINQGGGYQLRAHGADPGPYFLTLVVKDGIPSSESFVSAASVITAQNWTYAVAVFDNNSKAAAVYVDGAQISNSTIMRDPSVSATTVPLRIGESSVGTNPPTAFNWDGQLDEIRVSAVARSADWIRAEYNNQNAPGDIGAAGFYAVGPETVALGEPCSTAADCVGLNCVDSVCCDSSCGGACEACSLTAGAPSNGTCGLLGPTVVCRASAGICDLPESCSGGAPNCPPDSFSPSTTVCRPPAGACDTAEACSGSGALCAPDDTLPEGTACRPEAACHGQACLPNPPRIVSAPTLEAECGSPYLYSPAGVPAAEGEGPFRWSVGTEAPVGVEVDAETGSISWTPRSAQAGRQRLSLSVANGGGTANQSFDVEVRCHSAPFRVACGCNATGLGGWLSLAALVVFGRLRRFQCNPDSRSR